MSERYISDRPPHSRLFLTCYSDVTAQKLRDCFSKFGFVEDLWQVKSKKPTNPDVQQLAQSLWYIKFNKSSSALTAIEEMNGKAIEEGEQPIKVMMAFNRQETTVYRGRDGTDTLERIFFYVKDEDTVEILRQEFSQYGTITDCVILKQRYAYISFSRALEAARAIEGCDAKNSRYKPVVAEQPRTKKRDSDSGPPNGPPSKYGSASGDYPTPHRNGSSGRGEEPYYGRQAAHSPAAAGAPLSRLPDGCMDLSSALINNPTRCTKLFLRVNYPLSRETLFKLCNIIPMLENVELHREATSLQKTIALISYNNATAAGLAWQKFQDFEYPPGHALRLRYADAGFPQEWQFELALKHGYPFPSTEYAASYQSSAEYAQQLYGGGGNLATMSRRASPGDGLGFQY